MDSLLVMKDDTDLVIVVIDSLHKNHVEVSITATRSFGPAHPLRSCQRVFDEMPHQSAAPAKKPRPTVPHRLWEVRKCPKYSEMASTNMEILYDMTEVFIERWVFSQKLACCDGPGGIVGSSER